MQSVGVEAVPAAPGVAFDPSVHEAVLQDDEADLPEKTIARVVQPGFKYRGRLLRPARVVVASGKGKRQARERLQRPTQVADSGKGERAAARERGAASRSRQIPVSTD